MNQNLNKYIFTSLTNEWLNILNYNQYLFCYNKETYMIKIKFYFSQ